MSTVADGLAPVAAGAVAVVSWESVAAWVTRACGAIGAQHVKIFAVLPRAGANQLHVDKERASLISHS